MAEFQPTQQTQSSSNVLPTLETVKQLPLDEVYAYALKHLLNLERKKKWNRKYNADPSVKKRQRMYYYVRHDIYHPIHHPQGRQEKRFKRFKRSENN